MCAAHKLKMHEEWYNKIADVSIESEYVLGAQRNMVNNNFKDLLGNRF